MSNEVVPIEQSGSLMNIAETRRMLAECTDPKAVKKMLDQATAAEEYFRKHREGREMALAGAEIKIWASLRLGDLLGPAMSKAQAGSQKGKKQSNDLSAFPGSPEWHRRWRIMRLVSDKWVEEYIEAKKAEEKLEITSADVFRQGERIARQRKQREANLGDEPETEESGPIPTGVLCGETPAALKPIPDNTFHLIIADSPYNIGIDYGDGPEADLLPDGEFVAQCAEWIAECYRVLRPTGTMWLIIGDEYADYLGVELRKAGFHRRAWIKWYETFGVCNSKMTNFNRCSRHLFYCTKDPKRFTFNSKAIMTKSSRQEGNDPRAVDPIDIWESAHVPKDEERDPMPDSDAGKVWDDVWKISRVQGTSKERRPEFPTQLPIKLIEPIVLCCSNPGNFILDPFLGSGTTGIVAKMHGRKFLGIEKRENFAELAGRYIAKVKKKT
jgi:DNA modification methylase